jgi:DUF4097 and DUF4098 domain-containing protein YvlB
MPEAGLKGMTVNDAGASVKGLEQERLYISQNAGRIWMSDSRIGKIQIEASSKSFLNISATDLDTLSAKIDSSEVSISSPVGLLEGSMKNKSFLRMNDIDQIQFEKDETSRFNLY